MSYIEKSKQNQANAAKAKAFDALNQQHRDRQVYEAGAGDAYTDVEQRLMARAQQAAMQQQIAEASYGQQFANQDMRGPAPTVSEEPVYTPNPDGAAYKRQLENEILTNILTKNPNISPEEADVQVQEGLAARYGGL